VDDVAEIATPAFKGDGQAIFLVGQTSGWLGQSIYLSELCGREEGAPPPVDLAVERRHGDFVRDAIRAGRLTAVHDIAEGGLAVALAEMAMDGNTGAQIEHLPGGAPAHAILFGEDQGRYIVTTRNEAALISSAEATGVPLTRLGTTGGEALVFPGMAAISVAELKRVHEEWLPNYMAGAPAPTN
jgi:phosphoribosylformylglycinamidine synthase